MPRSRPRSLSYRGPQCRSRVLALQLSKPLISKEKDIAGKPGPALDIRTKKSFMFLNARGLPSITLDSAGRFFLGCEGESEQSYGALLQIIANESLELRIHLDLQLLGGADPLAIVEAAVEKARERSRNRGRFVRCAVLLDSDRHGHAPGRDNRIAPLAHAHCLGSRSASQGRWQCCPK